MTAGQGADSGRRIEHFGPLVAFPLIGPVVAYRGWLEPQK